MKKFFTILVFTMAASAVFAWDFTLSGVKIRFGELRDTIARRRGVYPTLLNP